MKLFKPEFYLMFRRKGGEKVEQVIMLIEKSKAGDTEAFEELLKLHSDQLYRTAFLYVGNRDDTLDIVQETSFNAFLAIKKLKHNQYFSTWLTRILINCANDYLRKNKKHIPFADVDPFISRREEMNLEHIDLIRAINKLKPKYRNAVILFYFRDLPIKDIASIMEVPENTVKTYLHRGKKQLKNKLKGVGYDERKILSEGL